jgi:predicted dehydrogenase
MTGKTTRRTFITTATIATTAAPGFLQAAAPNDRVRVGLIGCGGRGRTVASQFAKMPDAQIVAVCDVYEARREQVRANLGGASVRSEKDFRAILDAKDVDAVIVATPGHWHVLPTVAACAAGKDVYVEKPLGTSIAEGRAAVTAARKHNRVVQIGTQQRSWDIYRKAVEVIRSGRLGVISEVKVWDNENDRPGFGRPPDTDAPDGLDWDLWVGPAPSRRFNPNRFAHHYWFQDYGGGWPLDWAVHHYDIVHWAMDATAPKSAVATGGHYAFSAEEDDREWPDTLTAGLEYGPTSVAPRGFLLSYTTRSGNRGTQFPHGKSFFGTEASLHLDRTGFTIDVEPKKGRKPATPEETVRGETEDQANGNHVRAFLDRVKDRARPLADVENGHTSSVPGHLINIAWRVGRVLKWDAATEHVIDDPEADALVSRSYRAPWALES